MYRQTYATINGDILRNNVKDIVSKYNNYKYYIGVVKNNAYGHGIYIVNDLIAGGVNYLAVSSLEEALDIRKYNVDIPILCLEPIIIDYIYDAINNNVAITVEDLTYVEELKKLNIKDTLKIHIKIDSGMNRLGFKSRSKLNQAMEIIADSKHLHLEGIYTHFATSGISDIYWDKQLETFREITKNIDLKKIPMVHMGRSLTLVNHEKLDFCNGIRLGIVMYGFAQKIAKGNFLQEKKRQFFVKKYKISRTHRSNDLNLQTAFALFTKVLAIRNVKAGEFVGYGATFVANNDMIIATLPIGYADGISKMFKSVCINGKRYEIVADSMDMIMVKVDKSVKIGDKVEVFGDNIKIKEVTNNLNVNAYHLFAQITNRVPRVHINNNSVQEIKY